jgi:hypothetical protein
MTLKDKIEKLREFYVNYDLDWVEEFVNDLDGTMTDKEIEEKYKIVIEVENFSSIDNTLVSNCAYDTQSKNYTLTLNSRLLKDENWAALYRDQLIAEIKCAIAHEDTHRQQDQTSFEHLKNEPSEKRSEDYLSHHTEIAARARELVQYLINTGSNVLTQAMTRIATHKGLPKRYSDILSIYQEIGGDVYKKFLSEIYWAYDPHVIRKMRGKNETI